MTITIPDDMLPEYQEIIERNINSKAYAYVNANEFFDRFDTSYLSIAVVQGSKIYTRTQLRYDLGNDFEDFKDYFTCEEFQNKNCVSSWEEGDSMVTAYYYGDLETRIFPPDPENKSISLYQELNSTDTDIADYTASQSLISIGFDKYGNYNSEDSSIYLGIRKDTHE